VLFGPSSLNYGSDALGGTITFNTLSPTLAADGQTHTSEGHAVLRYGSANQEGTAHVDFNYGTEKFASLTSFTFSNFGDLRAGTTRNSCQTTTATLRATYTCSRRTARTT
jgi:hemoglobin/transferrin/lactoferrin receptor protein